MSKGITSRAENYSEWYNDLVLKGGLADYSAVRGCMVIKPYGFTLWENMRDILDKKFKETGHVNAYFPLFVPKSLFEAEETNAEGFAKECAVVTHYRLKTDPENKGKLIIDPEAKLEEELVVRPTSEAIIWNTYKKWIQSYRDLPILVNQWANVVRWEMRTRLFLRTAEFLWQEGHTAHATKSEAVEETVQMINVYADFVENYMAIPVIKGVKSANERFAGAEDTYTIEALMQDGKALQSGTSHFLGQNFAKAFDVKFVNKENNEEYVWATSWGVSTRLIGALIMAHSDDEGLIIPPKIAPHQVVIIPFLSKNVEETQSMIDKANELKQNLSKLGIRSIVDSDETKRPGFKFAEYELKGIPLRVVIGPRDLANGVVEIARRDTKEKSTFPIESLQETIVGLLDEIQNNLFAKAKRFRDSHITEVDDFETFQKVLEEKGGFISAHWDGTPETEDKIKELTKATIRCIPLGNKKEEGKCVFTGKSSQERVLFARAY
ncbi:MAG TPA: proline--tRNA ligase [Chitinophagales bacterium]|nr:proline--tRNA ligase [Chitinophagales bacterium]MCB9074805.1 proline--tRNA ligase [Chitinophagales bacterium]HMU97176.1 proline--tRNA ligase [Chitinophagales bacterium]HMV02392.1 proline--tRNA ligase [Chitinophagales bacterium]HMW94026.1 proline--tRNA ligase [Chitinophagales bacterium]